MSTDATSGKLVPTTVGGSACNIVTCLVKIAYDQSGLNGCSAAPCNMVAPTPVAAPVLTLSVLGSTACMVFTGSNNDVISTASASTVAQPYSVSAVSSRPTAGRGVIGVLFADQAGVGTGDAFVYYSATNDTVTMQSNSAQSATATDNSFHAMQFNFQGASGNFYIDGNNTSVGGSTGTNSMTLGFQIGQGAALFLTATVCELALYPQNNSTNQSALNTNQHSSGRWNF